MSEESKAMVRFVFRSLHVAIPVFPQHVSSTVLQAWWEHGVVNVRNDGDGRPISLTLFQAYYSTIRNFRIDAQPFWCNCIANSSYVTYDGMYCNATNTNPEYFGQKWVHCSSRLARVLSESSSLVLFQIPMAWILIGAIILHSKTLTCVLHSVFHPGISFLHR